MTSRTEGLKKSLCLFQSLRTKIEVKVKVIDAQRTDPTGRQHGVAWHVLVGDCGWKDPEQRSLIDERRVEAKRFTFIVEADLLHEAGAVKSDWSGIEEENETFGTINKAVQDAITKRLLEVTKEKRNETTANVRRSHAEQVKQMSPIRRENWNLFVEKVAEECPSLTETELKSVSGVLANMEVANSQYGLLHKLHELSLDQIDPRLSHHGNLAGREPADPARRPWFSAGTRRRGVRHPAGEAGDGAVPQRERVISGRCATITTAAGRLRPGIGPLN